MEIATQTMPAQEVIYPVNQFPDLGLPDHLPPDQSRLCRAALVSCIHALNAPDNFSGFSQAVAAVYETFGIHPTSDPQGQQFIQESLQKAYTSWHAQGLTRASMADLEYICHNPTPAEFGTYVNFYLYRTTDKYIVAPGACSQATPRSPIQGQYLPDRRFNTLFRNTFSERPFGLTPPTLVQKLVSHLRR